MNDDIASLQAELAQLQAPASLVAPLGSISERNAIEIVTKLIVSQLLQLIQSIDGTQWITKARLRAEVTAVLARFGGRATLHELQEELNVDSSHVEAAVHSLINGDGLAHPTSGDAGSARVSIVHVLPGGDVISKAYLDRVADAAAETVSSAGVVSLAAVGERFHLPADVLAAVFNARLDSNRVPESAATITSDAAPLPVGRGHKRDGALSACGAVLRGGLLVSPSYLRRQMRAARAAVIATTRPTPLSRIAAALAAGSPPLAIALDARFLDSAVRTHLQQQRQPVGSIRGDILVPSLFGASQLATAAAFLAANGALPLSRAAKLGFSEPAALLAALQSTGSISGAPPSHNTVLLLMSMCIVDPVALLVGPLAAIEDAVEAGSWLAVAQLVPQAALSPADVRVIFGVDDADRYSDRRPSSSTLPSRQWLPPTLKFVDLAALARKCSDSGLPSTSRATLSTDDELGGRMPVRPTHGVVASRFGAADGYDHVTCQPKFMGLSSDGLYLVSEPMLRAVVQWVTSDADRTLATRQTEAERIVRQAKIEVTQVTNDVAYDSEARVHPTPHPGRAIVARARALLRSLPALPSTLSMQALIRAVLECSSFKFNPQGEALDDHGNCTAAIAIALQSTVDGIYARAAARSVAAVVDCLSQLRGLGSVATSISTGVSEDCSAVHSPEGSYSDDGRDDDEDDHNDQMGRTANASHGAAASASTLSLASLLPAALGCRQEIARNLAMRFSMSLVEADAGARGIESLQVMAPSVVGWPTLAAATAPLVDIFASETRSAPIGAEVDAAPDDGLPVRFDANDAALAALSAACLTRPLRAAASAALLWSLVASGYDEVVFESADVAAAVARAFAAAAVAESTDSTGGPSAPSKPVFVAAGATADFILDIPTLVATLGAIGPVQVGPHVERAGAVASRRMVASSVSASPIAALATFVSLLAATGCGTSRCGAQSNYLRGENVAVQVDAVRASARAWAVAAGIVLLTGGELKRAERTTAHHLRISALTNSRMQPQLHHALLLASGHAVQDRSKIALVLPFEPPDPSCKRAIVEARCLCASLLLRAAPMIEAAGEGAAGAVCIAGLCTASELTRKSGVEMQSSELAVGAAGNCRSSDAHWASAALAVLRALKAT